MVILFEIHLEKLRQATWGHGKDLSRLLGITERSLSRKLNHKQPVTIEEINKILHYLNLNAHHFVNFTKAEKSQKNLIPDTPPEIPGYEVFWLYHPRGGVGGDYYDYIQQPDGSWGLAIADCSGKGEQVAMLMAIFQAGLRSEAIRHSDLWGLMVTLNALVHASGKGKFATLFYAELQPEVGLLNSINAGHNYPLLIRQDGSSEWLGMDKGSAPLGLFPDDKFLKLSDSGTETTRLSSGDVVLFYTDGVTETGNTSNEMYEEERLQDAATRVRHVSAKDICTAIYDSLMEFQGEAQQYDDLTLMVLKRK